jgi:6-pyruvoyltetrahydropterin/6-carboxytetrahydropterin synthase
MFYVKKTLEISASHSLVLNYESKCQKNHGHNWRITVYCASMELNENGMVIDFSEIKKLIFDKLDHNNLNEVLPFNPTAENIAYWIVATIPKCYRAEVVESENNEAVYEI